jgi:hypothetical protein
MGLLEAATEPVNRHVGIDLGGGEAGMAEELLNCA